MSACQQVMLVETTGLSSLRLQLPPRPLRGDCWHGRQHLHCLQWAGIHQPGCALRDSEPAGPVFEGKPFPDSLRHVMALLTEINERLIDLEVEREMNRYINPDVDEPPLLGLRQRIKDRYAKE